MINIHYSNIHEMAPEQLVQAVKKFKRNGVEVILGPYTSDQCVLALQGLRKSNIPLVSFFASDTNLFYLSPYFFSLSFSNRDQAAKIRDFVINQKTHKVFTVLYTLNNRYIRNLIFWLKRLFFRDPDLKFSEIDFESPKRKDSLRTLLQKKHFLFYINPISRNFEAFSKYIELKKINIKATILLPDGLRVDSKNIKKLKGFMGSSYWFSYPKYVSRDFKVKSFSRAFQKSLDAQFILRGLDLIRKASVLKKKYQKSWLQILESNFFSPKEFQFDKLHFSKIPVTVYQITSDGKIIKK